MQGHPPVFWDNLLLGVYQYPCVALIQQTLFVIFFSSFKLFYMKIYESMNIIRGWVGEYYYYYLCIR